MRTLAEILPPRFRIGRRMTERGAHHRGQPLRRFTNHSPLDPLNVQPLRADHPALKDATTIFPSTVVPVESAGRLLVSGMNSRKLGSRVTKGAWAGMPIFHLTLEERATCPSSCELWRHCYGNAMHMAKRIDHHDYRRLCDGLRRDLTYSQAEHRRGFVVRLHNLGDFFSVAYVRFWAEALVRFPGLRIFGYTHWQPETPIGGEIARLREFWWDRFAIRTSVPHGAASTAPGPIVTTIDYLPDAPRIAEGLICPAQTGKTACCGSCGLCWAEGARDVPIVFVLHGMKRGGRPSRKPGTGPLGGRPVKYGSDELATVLELWHTGTMTYAEIGRQTGLTRSAVSGIVFRNRHKEERR